MFLCDTNIISELYNACFDRSFADRRIQNTVSFSSIQSLKKQLVAIPEIIIQLAPISLGINIETHIQQNNLDKLAKAFANRIFKHYNLPIPAIADIYDLQREIIHLKQNQKLTNISLVLHEADPSDTILELCQFLQDDLQICFICDRPIPPPFHSLSPNQDDIKTALQTWCDRL